MNDVLDLPFVRYALVLSATLIGLRIWLERGQFYALMAGSVFAFVFAEGFCRISNLGNPAVAVWEQAQSQGTKYAYPPRARLVFRYPDNPRGYFDEANEVHASINSKGFRGVDRDFGKPDGIWRIAFLGDSFTLGVGVKDEHTLPESFARAMQVSYPSVEVLNFGISGSTTERQIRLLEEYVSSFQPDVVVLVLFVNDAVRRGTIGYLSRATVFRRIREVSHFANALVGSVERIFLHRKMVAYYLDGYADGRPGWESVKSALRRGRAFAEVRDFQLAVALYPVLIQLDESYPFGEIHETIERFCASIGIPFVDLFPAFVGKRDSQLWVHASDQHPNETAHRLAGERLSEQLDRSEAIRRRLGERSGSEPAGR